MMVMCINAVPLQKVGLLRDICLGRSATAIGRETGNKFPRLECTGKCGLRMKASHGDLSGLDQVVVLGVVHAVTAKHPSSLGRFFLIRISYNELVVS